MVMKTIAFKNTGRKLLTLNLGGGLAALHDRALPLKIEEASGAISSCADEMDGGQWQTYTWLDMMVDAVKYRGRLMDG